MCWDRNPMAEALRTDNGTPGLANPEFLLRLLRVAPSVCLILDYDGTLVPIMPHPNLAFPDPELMVLLESLSEQQDRFVHIVSGRARSQLDQWFGALSIGLHAEHGVWSRPEPSEPWRRRTEAVDEWPADILEAIKQSCSMLPGSFLEVKSASLAFHYRQARRDLVAGALPTMRAHLSMLARHHRLDVLDGARVIELRPLGVSKAAAVRLVLERLNTDSLVVVLGDDTTDEDMFRASPPDALTVHVGSGPSLARHRLAGPAEVRTVLQGLL